MLMETLGCQLPPIFMLEQLDLTTMQVLTQVQRWLAFTITFIMSQLIPRYREHSLILTQQLVQEHMQVKI